MDQFDEADKPSGANHVKEKAAIGANEALRPGPAPSRPRFGRNVLPVAPFTYPVRFRARMSASGNFASGIFGIGNFKSIRL